MSLEQTRVCGNMFLWLFTKSICFPLKDTLPEWMGPAYHAVSKGPLAARVMQLLWNALGKFSGC